MGSTFSWVYVGGLLSAVWQHLLAFLTPTWNALIWFAALIVLARVYPVKDRYVVEKRVFDLRLIRRPANNYAERGALNFVSFDYFDHYGPAKAYFDGHDHLVGVVPGAETVHRVLVVPARFRYGATRRAAGLGSIDSLVLERIKVLHETPDSALRKWRSHWAEELADQPA
jgi:hypothetical protein